jgi:hypothetical protein
MRHRITVVVLTTCRTSLLRALRSVFGQSLREPMQVLIGVDRDPDRRLPVLFETLRRECPTHITLSLLNMGYSTSVRHGGPHASHFGGSLRSAMTFLADSNIVTYLDDDDWFAPDHCERILAAIHGKSWAYTYSIYADGNTGQGLCVDEIESVGVSRGVYAQAFGGFVRPSGLTIDKLKVLHLVHVWSQAKWETGDGEDRLLFDQLCHLPHGCTEAATVYAAIDPKDDLHEFRLKFIRSKGIDVEIGARIDSNR